jgi:hypothetical protein
MRDVSNAHRGYKCAPEQIKKLYGASALITFGYWGNPPGGGWQAEMWVIWSPDGTYRLWSWTNTTAQDYALFASVIEKLQAFEAEGLSPMEFCQLLEQLGYQDEYHSIWARDDTKTNHHRGKRVASQTQNRPRGMFPPRLASDPTHERMILQLIDRLSYGEKCDTVAIPDLLEEMNDLVMSREQFDQAILALVESGLVTIGVNACGYGNIVLA